MKLTICGIDNSMSGILTQTAGYKKLETKGSRNFVGSFCKPGIIMNGVISCSVSLCGPQTVLSGIISTLSLKVEPISQKSSMDVGKRSLNL